MKKIRKSMAEFCPFCGAEMCSHGHVSVCLEAHKYSINGIFLHISFYRDKDGDLWGLMYDVSKGSTILIPMGSLDNEVIDHINHVLASLIGELG